MVDTGALVAAQPFRGIEGDRTGRSGSKLTVDRLFVGISAKPGNVDPVHGWVAIAVAGDVHTLQFGCLADSASCRQLCTPGCVS